MNQVNYDFDQYQASVLRTANRDLDWNQTVENCLLGLVGEIAEVIAELNTDSEILNTIVNYGQACEAVKKIKYHGKTENLLNHLSYDALITAESSLKPVHFLPEDNANLIKETGDVLYYLVWLIDTLGQEASEIAQANVDKLRKRYATGFSIEKSLNRKD